MKVFVNGTFDLLHPGHISLLNSANAYGDILLVAIDSDDRVKQLKGSGRPINNQEARKTILENLKPVDSVKFFSSEEELVKIIKRFSPDVMIVGSDYKDKRVIGSEYAKKLVFFKRDPRFSSTYIIDKVINEHTLRAADL
jgi:D-beta-D-heptose 7-phosphate kinase/D-beta-D-heptose 1-phosphate adenosyltransferase